VAFAIANGFGSAASMSTSSGEQREADLPPFVVTSRDSVDTFLGGCP
jgi:hypothetical protein